ncbi:MULTISPECIES: HAD hydrolase family protein [unclassified Variovorax]|uniref:HAD hydrolase family protein n=2 Tax=Variovorax TaxID=34072 RepID=UPI00076CBB5D|nr:MULTISPECIES: HAD hydrolase family protein [unclassified Variovorax]KWT91609.1 Cof-like hydrolase family protein [Variovorax sp. WDL1]PNG48991.1 Sugar phosphatase YidA [Variovorax sp. B4]PNG49731.1 Sugar phosphatase YidA [Variovorax sp. B2]VTV18566.1 Sugar phosphatase YidA [Variovorax sp. WDL1]
MNGPFGAFNGGTLFEFERVGEPADAAHRPRADQRHRDAGGLQPLRRFDVGIGQGLAMPHQRAIDVADDEADRDAHGAVIGEPERLAPEVTRRILSILDEAEVDVWLFAHERWHARDDRNPHVPREKLSAALEPTIRSDLENLCDVADKIVGVSDDAALLMRLEAAMQQATQGEATGALSQPYFLDATALKANKGDGVAAVAAVAAAMRVPLAEVAVIGDMPNDLPMFARAGLSIALGQAPEAVRAGADWTTASNEEAGVAQAIDRLIGEHP